MKISPTRFIPFLLIACLLSVAECKAASPQSAAPQIGYEYTVRSGDTVEDIAQAYREQGVDVTAKQILDVNPNVKFRTVLKSGLKSHLPEIGVKLFIPGQVKPKEEIKLIAPRLIEPLDFAYFTVSDIHGAEGASNLMSQKIRIGTDDPNAYQFLSKNGTNIIKVESVNEYRAAIKNGFAATSTADLTMEGWFLQADQVLSFMERAKPSKQSLFTAQDLKYLPVSLLNWTEGWEGRMLKDAAKNGMTLKDCTSPSSKHHIRSLKIKDNNMTFSDNGCDYYVRELARGDLDGDGYEDALVYISTYYQGGSGRFYQAYVVSRTDPKQGQLKLSVLNAVLQSTTDSPIKP